MVFALFCKSLNPCFSGTYSRSLHSLAQCVPVRCLNPCFSGTYSRRSGDMATVHALFGLNPCFSGTYSRRANKTPTNKQRYVLILVLVEHTLGGGLCVRYAHKKRVLILVLVEHTLGDLKLYVCKCKYDSLNPCFSGTYSRRATFATSTISMHYAPKNGT